jgi:ornithine cyclodeaminase
MASTFDGKGNGMILLCDAANGKPLVYLDDAGYLTDVRTAAVAAMTARELRRSDRSIGILGSGIQARLTAYYHQRVLPLEQIFLWGRNARSCRRLRRRYSRRILASFPAYQNSTCSIRPPPSPKPHA